MIKLTADECVTPRRFESLIPSLAVGDPPIQAVHLLKLNGQQGLQDDQWAERLGREGGWIVVTGDRGRRAEGPRLPRVLPAAKVTGVFLSGKLQSSSGDDKLASIQWMIKRIDKIAKAPPGTRFRLNRDGDSFRLEIWPV